MISVDATALIILAIVFGLVLVLKNLLFEPLARAMETRQDRIERAETAWDDAEETIAQARARVAGAVQGARNQGYELLDRARTDALKKARSDLDASRQAAQNRLAEARERLRGETERAVKSLEVDAQTLAAAIATRILGRDVA